MTTDTHAQGGAAPRGDGFTVGGMAKGSGMIHPDLATMLAVVTTDYPLAAGRGDRVPRAPPSSASFNAISVDGEPSTNDCVILLANGASGSSATRDRRGVRGGARARSAPTSPARSSPTARASRCSPRSPSPARSTTRRRKAIARRIATSPLVKTALFGHDANWGRVLMAAGSAPVERRLRRGRRRARHASATTAPSSSTAARPLERRARRLRARAARSSSTSGSAAARAGYLTTDLSYDYVRINADYRT